MYTFTFERPSTLAEAQRLTGTGGQALAGARRIEHPVERELLRSVLR